VQAVSLPQNVFSHLNMKAKHTLHAQLSGMVVQAIQLVGVLQHRFWKKALTSGSIALAVMKELPSTTQIAAWRQVAKSPLTDRSKWTFCRVARICLE